MREGVTLGAGLLWVLAWLGFMLFYTFLDVAVWRKLPPQYEAPMRLATIVLCQAGFLSLLCAKTGFRLRLSENVSVRGILLAAVCAALMYLLLDRALDPFIENLFPSSQEKYLESLEALGKAPAISLIQVCVLAPFIEELLTRGFLLDGLAATYGTMAALAVSAALFALLHFNAVQTISALLCGVLLGLLYIRTGSVLCCILAHMCYNFTSYITTILPLVKNR